MPKSVHSTLLLEQNIKRNSQKRENRYNMGFTSFLKSPKKEQHHEVPDNTILSCAKFVDTKINHRDDHGVDVDLMEDLERILGIEDHDAQKLTIGKTSVCQLSWDMMDWDEFRKNEEDEDEEEEEDMDDEAERERDSAIKFFGKDDTKCFFEEESFSLSYEGFNDDHHGVVKREVVGFWDDDFARVSLNLNLNYQEVLDAWSDRGSLWADDCPLSMQPNGCYMGEVPVLMEEEKARREASVMRYKEKRQSRLFSKKIRYEVRKLNADKRPRLKGRFVKRI